MIEWSETNQNVATSFERQYCCVLIKQRGVCCVLNWNKIFFALWLLSSLSLSVCVCVCVSLSVCVCLFKNCTVTSTLPSSEFIHPSSWGTRSAWRCARRLRNLFRNLEIWWHTWCADSTRSCADKKSANFVHTVWPERTCDGGHYRWVKQTEKSYRMWWRTCWVL